MRAGFQKLVAAICSHKLNDGADVIRAGAENEAGENIWTMAQDKGAYQLVNEGLGGLNPAEIKDALFSAQQGALQ